MRVITKRNKEVVNFDLDKIICAIDKAFKSSGFNE